MRAKRQVLVTGARGFIGKNLTVRLGEQADIRVLEFGREDRPGDLSALVGQADAIVHLAGENRPSDLSAYARVNAELTQYLCEIVRHSGRRIPLILASSTQAEQTSPYGMSKLAAEQAVEALAASTGNPAVIYRLPGVFGKWCRPNYNSVVATFCHNLARGLPIQISDPATTVRLVYIDDVVTAMMGDVCNPTVGFTFGRIDPEYSVTLGELATMIRAFSACRDSLVVERVGEGFVRALYATYVSYLPVTAFAYPVPRHSDPRGVFVEMLKTHDSGQFSYFTAHPGVTRGGHYHHSKTEKFLVIKGRARFGFRHIVTGERYEIQASGVEPMVVETVPGWTHDITNVGDDEMVVMLWANEIFDRNRPDTIANKV